MGKLSLVYKWLLAVATGLAAAALSVMVLIITADVTSRYVFLYSLRNVNEISGYLLVLLVFMGAAYAHRRDAHIKVDIVVKYLPIRVRRWLAVAMEVLALLFVGLVLVWLAARFSIQSYEVSAHFHSSMRTPLWIPEVLVPVGSAIFLLEIVRRLIIDIKNTFKECRKGN